MPLYQILDICDSDSFNNEVHRPLLIGKCFFRAEPLLFWGPGYKVAGTSYGYVQLILNMNVPELDPYREPLNFFSVKVRRLPL